MAGLRERRRRRDDRRSTPKVTAVDPDSTAAFQVVAGLERSDVGRRRARARCSFPRAPRPRWCCRTAAPSRSTSWTSASPSSPTAASGDEAMPGALPATTGYTYAAEFSVDEALAAGATEVRLRQAGRQLHRELHRRSRRQRRPDRLLRPRARPSGSPSENGRVIEIVSEAGGRPASTSTATATADPAPTLAALGITDAERVRLAALYDPGQELWRVPHRPLHAVGPQLAVRPAARRAPADAQGVRVEGPERPVPAAGLGRSPARRRRSARRSRSPARHDAQLPSDRTPGWTVDETLDIPIVGSTAPGAPEGHAAR